MSVPFKNRAEAGRYLAAKLSRYVGDPKVRVLALPRGGVPVAYEIAQALSSQLDVFVVRKLGVPGHEEMAMGAIASGGVKVINRQIVEHLEIPKIVIERVIREESHELERREALYRGEQRPLDVKGCTVLLVDDGLATGATMRAAVVALRRLDPARIVVAVPAAARATCDEIKDLVDEIVCAVTPEPFLAVGMWYEDFSQTTDAEVRDLLERANSN